MRCDSFVLRSLVPGVAIVAMLVGASPAAYADILLPQGIDVVDVCAGPESIAYSFQNQGGDGAYFVQAGEDRYGPFATAPSLVWSEDGRTLAFTVREGNTSKLYVDGRFRCDLGLFMRYWLAPAGGGFVAVGEDQGRYTCQYNDTRFVLFPTMQINPGMGVQQVQWLPDGSAPYFVVRDSPYSRVYRGSEMVALHQSMGKLTVGAEGQVIYAADGALRDHTGNALSHLSGGVAELDISPRDGAVAYWPNRADAAWSVMAGNRNLGDFDNVKGLVWAPNGEHVAFVYGTRRYLAGEQDVFQFVHAGSQSLGPYYEVQTTFSWSPDGDTPAYVAQSLEEGHPNYVFAAGNQYGPFPGSIYSVSLPIWSPDGRSVCYAVRGDAGSRMYVNDRMVLESSGSLYPRGWSSDGLAIGFDRYGGRSRTYVLLDGREYRGSVSDGRLAYVDGGRMVVR